MSNIKNQSNKFYYSLKLDKLNENELSYLSNSLNIPVSDNKKDMINNILNKLEVLKKDEFDKIFETIDNLLKKKDDNKNIDNDNNNINKYNENQSAPNPETQWSKHTKQSNSKIDFKHDNKHDSPSFSLSNTDSMTPKNNESIYNNNIEIIEQKFSIDKIFFLYAPEVNPNSKKNFYLFWYCYCCFSISIETYIKFHFFFQFFYFIWSIFPLVEEINIYDCLYEFVELIFKYYLYITIKNNKSQYARYNLLYNEILFLYNFFTIKNRLNETDKLYGNKPVCEKNDFDSNNLCWIYYIILNISKFIIITSPVNIAYKIYIAYYQLTLIKHKTLKKIE